MKVPKEITAYERRKYELIVKSGVTGKVYNIPIFLMIIGTNKPFRAPVYMTYKEAYKALVNQGVLGFYKGNLIGLTHTWLNSYLKFSLMNMFNLKDYDKIEHEAPILKGFFSRE